MTRHWESGVSYGAGDVLEYHGQRYKVIQAHSSQNDWAPGTATAALFEHLDSSEHHEPPQQCHGPHHEHPQVPTHRDTNPSESLNNPPTSKIDSFGGRDGWLQDARQRADEFHRGGPRAPTTWVLTSGHEIPPLAVEAGKEGDNMLYVARSYVEDGLYVGKAGKHLKQGAEIGRQHKCHALHEYEILIDAGVDAHGHQIFVAQVSHNGGVHPARADSGASGAYLAYGDHELTFEEYRVLCYA